VLLFTAPNLLNGKQWKAVGDAWKDAWNTCADSLHKAGTAFNNGDYGRAFTYASGTTAAFQQASERMAQLNHERDVLACKDASLGDKIAAALDWGSVGLTASLLITPIVTPYIHAGVMAAKAAFAAEDLTFVGYHGTTSTYIDSILTEINPPNPGANFGGKYQLGPGFYTTEDLATAKRFAENATQVEINNLIKKYGEEEAMKMLPSPQVFKIYAKSYGGMNGATVAESAGWWDKFQPSLWEGYDYLESPISGFSSKITQRVFTPQSYELLRAILPK
jgi:hypothetical protein